MIQDFELVEGKAYYSHYLSGYVELEKVREDLGYVVFLYRKAMASPYWKTSIQNFKTNFSPEVQTPIRGTIPGCRSVTIDGEGNITSYNKGKHLC